MRPEVEQAFALLDNVCAQVNVNRASHVEITKALQLIHAELDHEPEINGKPASYEQFMSVDK